eukprot:CAMPEP_0117663234 /NCGR_PEP_ID=MMETSP0804-20121206/8494_1 /TAXON_ID=1074897 /ORGANISM="Tetraselmis astigmatica, Strain CCMP880" /LENGTH=167 /DNA_ID=CAMNT_0005470219 /DNA_START=259 /DNA_END=762 /DNA_ORIENTATION=-
MDQIWLSLLLLTALPSLSLGGKAGAKGEAELTNSKAVDCEALGFTTLALCSDCDAMADFVKDEDLIQDCRRCCAAETRANPATYASAVLEVCKHRLPSYPHVSDFLKSKAGKYKGQIKIRYRFGAYPQLILKTPDGKAGETVRVDNWKVEHFEEFLSSKLAELPLVE